MGAFNAVGVAFAVAILVATARDPCSTNPDCLGYWPGVGWLFLLPAWVGGNGVLLLVAWVARNLSRSDSLD